MNRRNKGYSNKPCIIVLAGLDGSGKSTQARILSKRLSSSGVKSVTLWNRWEPRVSAPIIRLAKRYLSSREGVVENDYRAFTTAKRRSMKGRWKRSLWQLMVWSEYLFEVYFRMLVPIVRGKAIILDRYYYDTVVDIAINFSLAPQEISNLLDHPLLKFYPRPKVLVVIDVEPHIGAKRKSDGTPQDYLEDRRPFYHEIARVLNAPIVDGSRSIEKVSEEIWNVVSSSLGLNAS